MALYTYDDFNKAVDKAGLRNQFSEADLNLAMSNPDAGMSILNSKIDFKNATTDEARALANANAENVRTTYGNYTGGTTGSSFTLGELTPMGYVSSPSPEYENSYKDKIDQALTNVTDRKPFEYDENTDPLYSAYRKQYLREGKRATEDTIGAAAAASGGVPSSYAATAAAQQGNYYSAALSDKLPELYEAAYNRYLNDFSMNRQALSDILSTDQNEFNKYQTDLSRYNTDRNFEYGQRLDEISNQRENRSEQLQKAILAFEHGDNSQLASLGIDTSNDPIIRSRNLEYALNVASMGDYSELAKLGYDITNIPQEIQNQIAFKQLEMSQKQLDDTLKTNEQNRWLNYQENDRNNKLTESQLKLNDDSLLTSAQNRQIALNNAYSGANSASSGTSGTNSNSVSMKLDTSGMSISDIKEEMTSAGVPQEIADKLYGFSHWQAVVRTGKAWNDEDKAILELYNSTSGTEQDRYNDYLNVYANSCINAYAK